MRSMTGFGRSSFEAKEAAFDVEVRSVNHRYLETRVRLPRPLGTLEAEVRARIQSRFARGKVDLAVVTPSGGAPPSRLEVDLAAARRYLRAAEGLRESESLAGEIDAGTLLALPGVACFVEPEPSAEELRDALFGAVDRALAAADEMRAAEGAAIERELLGRLQRVAELVDDVEARAGSVRETVVERLHKRAKQLEQETGLLDEARLHQEVVIAADRLDVTEELVRLRSHVAQFREICAAGGPGQPVGRQLDFLLQEFGREANTVGSKGSDAPIAHRIVELKTELERLREQVQNVE
jgi:uncharacterized protein (TIGR00255 family)